MDDLGVLQSLALGLAVAAMGTIIWGVLTGRIRPRGYRGSVALAAAILAPFMVTRSALEGQDSFVGVMVALFVAIGWGEFTVPKRPALRTRPPRLDP